MSYDKPTVPLNAFPQATKEGRPLPENVYRPAFFIKAKNETVTLPDQVNFVLVQVTDESIYLRDNAPYLMQNKPFNNTFNPRDLQGITLGVNRLTKGEHLMILGPSITVSGECFINGRTIWSGASPITRAKT